MLDKKLKEDLFRLIERQDMSEVDKLEAKNLVYMLNSLFLENMPTEKTLNLIVELLVGLSVTTLSYDKVLEKRIENLEKQI